MIWMYRAVLAVVVLGATGLARADEPGTPRFEVVVLGTYHAPGMFLNPDYTPAHIRATLEVVKPDVVAVESHPDWFAKGRYHVVTYEAEGVAVPWARDNGLPVTGVDWKDIEAWDRDMERRTLLEAKPLQKALARSKPLPGHLFGWTRKKPSAKASKSRRPGKICWQHINSEAYGRSRYRGKSPDDEDFAQERDRGIVANIVEVMRKHPGKRLAVVIGAHHKPYLEILLRKRGGVKVLFLGKDIPFPDAGQVRRAWTTRDLVVTLGHLLDAGSVYFNADRIDLPRARRILAMLESRSGSPEGEQADAVRYFRARILAHEGKPEAAARDLDALLEKGAEGEIYPFPMRQWRMRYTLSEAVRLEKARILLGRSRREEARALLAPVVKALDERLRRLEKAHPPETRRVEAVKDAGFERGSRASDYFSGWYTYLPTGRGKLRFTGDEKIKRAGKRSLRVEVVDPVPHAYGFHIRQEVKLPPAEKLPDRLRLGVDLRGENIEWARLEIVQAFPGRGSPHASRTVELMPGQWVRAEVEFPKPPRLQFGFVVRFRGPKGSRLWLDNASQLSAEYKTIPAEWPCLIKARGFLDTVLRLPAR